MLSVPQDELSPQFFNFNHQQCLLNQLRNYWHRAVLPGGQPPENPREKNLPVFLWDGQLTTTHFLFQALDNFNQSHLFWPLSSTPGFRETQGLGTDRNESVQAHPSTSRKTLVHTPRQGWMVTVKVSKMSWANGETTYYYVTQKPRHSLKANWPPSILKIIKQSHK